MDGVLLAGHALGVDLQQDDDTFAGRGALRYARRAPRETGDRRARFRTFQGAAALRGRPGCGILALPAERGWGLEARDDRSSR
jgi:hypothetical protein